MELYTQLTLIDCNGAQLGTYNHSNVVTQAHPPIPPTTLPPVALSALSNVDTSFFVSIQNPQLTTDPGGDKWYEFDIMVNDNVPNIYFVGGDFPIQYDTLIFGAHFPLTSANIEAIRGQVLADSLTYKLSLYFSTSRDQFKIIIGYDTTNNNFVDLPATPTKALHMRMRIINCNLQGNLSLIHHPVHPRFSFGSNIYSPNMPYDSTYYNATMFLYGCNLTISSVSPLALRGGVGDSLTIKGNGFGTSRGDGKVFFTNANDGGVSYLALDSADYGIWNDSVVTVNVPGIVDSLDQYNNMDGVPGSGFIMLKKNGGNDSIYYYGSPITITYSIISTIVHTTPEVKYRSDLANYYSTASGGYFIHPDVSITRLDSILQTLKMAVHDWVCETNVNYVVGDSVHAPDGTAHSDSTIIVQFGTPDDSSAVAMTYIWRFPDPGCGRTINKTFDMIIDSSLLVSHKIYADTNKCVDVPTGMYDLYAVFLHEFGHAIGLNHVNDLNSVMWFQQQTGTYAPARKVWLHHDHRSSDGGNYMTGHSQDSAIWNCVVVPMMTLLTVNNCDTGRFVHQPDCHFIGVSELDQNVLESVFPNPTSRYLTLDLTLYNYENTTVAVVDITGKSMNVNVNSRNGSTITLDIGDLTPGIYFGRVQHKHTSEVFKFIKE